jgi:hypothetical protein
MCKAKSSMLERLTVNDNSYLISLSSRALPHSGTLRICRRRRYFTLPYTRPDVIIRSGEARSTICYASGHDAPGRSWSA